MPFEVTERNLSALEPLFKPWEEPIRHRTPNPRRGEAAIIKPGRRPSKCPLVRSIRSQIDSWRKSGYANASDTSKRLLSHWFSVDHIIDDGDGGQIPFCYHWAQREAIETVIYLYEIRGICNVASILTEFGEGQLDDIALGIPHEEDRWGKYCCKMATGSGKTKVMSLAIVWSYFHRLFETDSGLTQHFVIIAPNLTVYERLKDDFENCSIFYNDPLLPEEWKSDFQMQVVLQDEPGGATTKGAIYLTNIHRLYESRNNKNEPDSGTTVIFGPDVKRAQALDTGEALRKRITNHPRLMVLNDEAHHLHDPELAWNKAIDSLHQQSLSRTHDGLCMQLDFTATPKHTDGQLFRHIMCDFPLGEAVDAGIVKVPLLGESDELIARGDNNTPAHERFAMHLNLGYQRYKKSYEEFEKVRKPILFVMTEDARAANEIANYLDSDEYPLLKDRVLNIHTRLKGRIKKVKRGGREIKEFVESETGMKPDDLRALREMSRDLDSKDSKFRCVVSVMMLREGWDVRNVTTIVPLRPYSAKAGILPEQTLGRGLRRMFPMADTPELVTVVHHPAFRKLYEEELQQEGLDIAVLPIRDVFKQTVTIFVDHKTKPVEDLEIEIPLVSDAIESTSELKDLTFDEVKDYFNQRYNRLPIGRKRDVKVEYRERHLFTDEVVTQMRLDVGLLTNAWSAIGYFSQMIGKACRLSNPHAVLAPILEKFLKEVLFEREVNIYNGEIDHRMRDMDVMEYIRATFTPLIFARTTHKKERRQLSKGYRLTTWKPYQATSTTQRPAVQMKRTMFNLVPCDNEFEQTFADFCDYANDVAAFAKNSGPQKLMIDYLRPDGNRSHYVPDFFIRHSSGEYYLAELKGKVDNLVPLKAQAAIEWCKVSSKNTKWRYLYIPYHLFQQSAETSVVDLARVCEPSLKALLEEAKSGQSELALLEATAETEAEELYSHTLEGAGIDSLPADIESVVRQAVQLLDYAVRTSMPTYAHAFQPFLGPLDKYSIDILEKRLQPFIPTRMDERDNFFDPYIDGVTPKQRNLMIRYQRYLRDNLVYGRSIQRLGTLLFCLGYALGNESVKPGIWEAIRGSLSGKQYSELYEVLQEVNVFRNTFVAHTETDLKDSELAWRAMHQWIRCVHIMLETAN